MSLFSVLNETSNGQQAAASASHARRTFDISTANVSFPSSSTSVPSSSTTPMSSYSNSSHYPYPTPTHLSGTTEGYDSNERATYGAEYRASPMHHEPVFNSAAGYASTSSGPMASALTSSARAPADGNIPHPRYSTLFTSSASSRNNTGTLYNHELLNEPAHMSRYSLGSSFHLSSTTQAGWAPPLTPYKAPSHYQRPQSYQPNHVESQPIYHPSSSYDRSPQLSTPLQHLPSLSSNERVTYPLPSMKAAPPIMTDDDAIPPMTSRHDLPLAMPRAVRVMPNTLLSTPDAPGPSHPYIDRSMILPPIEAASPPPPLPNAHREEDSDPEEPAPRLGPLPKPASNVVRRKKAKLAVAEREDDVSPITGLPKKQLSKRQYPPKDAARRKYICTEEGCGHAFGRPSALATHVRTHTGSRPFACPMEPCNRSFSVFSNLKRHMLKVHPKIDFRNVNVQDFCYLRYDETQNPPLFWVDRDEITTPPDPHADYVSEIAALTAARAASLEAASQKASKKKGKKPAAPKKRKAKRQEPPETSDEGDEYQEEYTGERSSASE